MTKKTKVRRLLNNVLSLFYPRICVSCGNALQQNEKIICLPCMLHLPETNNYKEHNNALKLVFAGRIKVEEVCALLYYTKGNNVQKILHAFKYDGEKHIGTLLGTYFGDRLIREERFQDIDLIIPIPLHPKKQKKRGYNQSEWIAKGLSSGMGIPYLNNILVRTDYTETQTKKSRFSRWENVKEVFAVKEPEKIKGKHLLICDDVLTTGATMEAAIGPLLKVEGVRVSVATLATAHH